MSFIYNLDTSGLTPNLLYKGDYRHKSFIGVCTSIICYLLFILYIVYCFIDLFDLKNLTIIFNKNKIKYPSLNISQFPIMVSVLDMYGYPIKDIDKAVRIQAGLFERKGSQIKLTNITFEKCERNIHLGQYSDLLSSDYDLSNYYCINPKNHNITIYGVYGDKFMGFSNFEIYITKCFNDGVLSYTECLNSTVIDKNLRRLIINVISLDVDVDNYNLDNPFSYYFKSEFLQASATVYRKFFNKKKMINYITDYGLIFQSLKNSISFQNEIVESTTDLRVDDPSFPLFFQYSIVLSDINDVYYRKFVKFQFIFGNIGIIFKVIFLIGNYFSRYFSQKQFYLELHQMIFTKYLKQIEYKNNFDFKFTFDNLRNKKYTCIINNELF